MLETSLYAYDVILQFYGTMIWYDAAVVLRSDHTDVDGLLSLNENSVVTVLEKTFSYNEYNMHGYWTYIFILNFFAPPVPNRSTEPLQMKSSMSIHLKS